MSSKKSIKIHKKSALFLDRDGVLNRRIVGDYVRNIEQLEILPGVLDTISKCTGLFSKIFVVTNQQGIGKGLMTEDDLYSVHEHLLDAAKAFGGHIDEFYFAPQLASENSEFRKPNIGMAAQAKAEFSMIKLKKSFMIGDSMSDMEFGRNAGMTTFFISDVDMSQDENVKKFVDYQIACLEEFQTYLP